MVLNTRSLRLLQSAFLTSSALHQHKNLPYYLCDYPQQSWRRCLHALASSAPLGAFPTVLSGSACMEKANKPLSTHPPADKLSSVPVSHQCRFMAIRRKRRGASGPQKPVIQKLIRPVDEEIVAATVRLVEGDTHSLVSKEEAIARARQQGLNLVQLNKQATEPVCRILDYSQLQQEHEEEAEKKASKAVEAEVQASKMKAIRIGCAAAAAMAQVHRFPTEVPGLEIFSNAPCYTLVTNRPLSTQCCSGIWM